MKNIIHIEGAREHNLKNLTLDVPRHKLVVLTGLSGSGKSSLAFDTIYAEGQRRYVESLSSYARQFLGQMEKPDVDKIEGLSPAIAIDQKTTSHNPRSTVGTVTEIYDYLRLLYARVGTVHCHQCGRVVSKQTIDQMIEQIMQFPEKTRLLIMAPIIRGAKGEFSNQLNMLQKQGFFRVRIDQEVMTLEEPIKLEKNKKHTIEVIVDRLIIREDILSRLADSLETAVNLTKGLVAVQFQTLNEDDVWQTQEKLFSQNFSCAHCNIDIGEIEPRIFSFNSPYGACPSCAGLGQQIQIDPSLVVYDDKLSLNDGAIQAIGWNFSDPKSWSRGFIEALAERYQFSLDTAFKKLSKKIRDIILFGDDTAPLTIDTSRSKYQHKQYVTMWQGVIPIMEKRYRESENGEIKDFYEPYLSITPCPICHGARLNQESLGVTIGGYNIFKLTKLSLNKAQEFLQNLSLKGLKSKIAAPILKELNARLNFLLDVGLNYLDLARSSSTLSGGESQRIRLATQIGSGLTGVLYILDEPSIGLHQRDNQRLLDTLKKLRDLGNTVLVVEHDEETIREADHIIDIGPGAGENGGYLVAEGRLEDIIKVKNSITGQYLSGVKKIALPEQRRKANQGTIKIKAAKVNNLKNINVEIPLGLMVCVTGVSGSGKSSLVNEIILKQLQHKLNGTKQKENTVKTITGIEQVDKVISIDQSPIGRTPRSNPATYTGVFDHIRTLFSQTVAARAKGYKPGRFSFNVKGGRCEACKGDGVNKIEMHFLPDLYVQCDQCHGKRYNRETLEVKYKGKNISDVLAMTTENALKFFEAIPQIKNKLQTLVDVGLSYITLGQPSTQLSGGEAQRVKLAKELSKRNTGKTFYVLDEPTTGLHVADVKCLINILQRLTDQGNTVLIIEHNLDVIKVCDYVIDLGPEGGENGGEVIATGTPETVSKNKQSYTGQHLHHIFSK